jgi:2-deoxy-D-gluconate 3-dehydrogenase
MQDLFDLTGKTALVTGANRGLGRAIAVGLAQAGADVIGVSASLEASASAVASDVLSTGRSFTAIRCDLSRRAAVHRLVNEIADGDGRIDILVNNAGAIRRAPAAEHSDADWDYVLGVNLSAPFILTRELGRQMLERGQGKIIFIASLLSFQGGITVPGYAASKSGVAALTRAFANEWASSHVNVNAIAPGYMATDNTQALRDDPVRSAAILQRIPAGRWGRAEDVAGAAIFLASAASDYVHGTVLTVDGGWMSR